ncbi:hypothetical protein [Pelistega sp. MC2]|uniref:hypothetical protein n=1 Tax=Pelistega sp. MC2 TaxID=1720297 RepID=UPI0008D9BB6F|nr:hypothetical protein [Pelistega sp. MC2]
MLDLLMEPVKIFIKGGVEKFLKSKELKNMQVAYVAMLLRETRFNKEVLKEITADQSEDKTEIAPLVNCLKTEAFDALNNSLLPLNLVISGDLKCQKDYFCKDEKYLEWIKSDKTISDLLERTYFRLHITKTLVTISNKKWDYGYISFLLNCLQKELLSFYK